MSSCKLNDDDLCVVTGAGMFYEGVSILFLITIILALGAGSVLLY